MRDQWHTQSFDGGKHISCDAGEVVRGPTLVQRNGSPVSSLTYRSGNDEGVRIGATCRWRSRDRHCRSMDAGQG